MKLPERENKVNWNTAISALGFAVVVAVYLVSFGEFRAQVFESNRSLESLTSNIEDWRVAHMEYHRERAGELSGANARVDQRITGLENRMQDLATLTHRVTVVEQGAASLTKSVAELTSAMSTISGDIRVIRESILRLERENMQTDYNPSFYTPPRDTSRQQ